MTGRARRRGARPGSAVPFRATPSRRAAAVQTPIIPTVAGWIAGTPGTISLGQGVVGYGPPPSAAAAIRAFLARPDLHKYQPDAGLPGLRAAFEKKLRRENGIDAPFARRIIVTAGANQAFLNAVLCVCDPGDEVILLSPYYFNHEMAIALAGARPVAVPTDDRYQPRLSAIADAITRRTRAVVTVSPNNPTGAVYPEKTLRAINRLCAHAGVFHISDEAYEHFTYDGAAHFSPGSGRNGGHTISLFSLSKSHGMASWRVGFLVAPEPLYDDLLKIQDTNAICAPAIAQWVGLAAMRAGKAWRAPRLRAIAAVRRTVFARLAAAPDLLAVPPSRGAFYFFARVRTEIPALRVAERLVREHKVAV
ncbi:MAG: aminotransferase class I/II-fold pyridoxal phosphate-dependent enzyme, partial [Gemmatimonadota bacterium]